MFKKQLLIICLTVCFLGSPHYSFADTNTSPYCTAVIESTSIKGAQIGTDWQLKNSFYVDNKQIKAFSQKFGANVLALKNDVFSNGQQTLQINYVQTSNQSNASIVFEKLIQLSGNTNVIAQKGNVVIEIIAPSIQLKETLLTLIKPSKVHKHY